MSARSPACSPSTRRSERGVAVIMAMLTVALVAALAASVVAAFGFAVESLSGRHDLAQARWLARGAIDWARNVLADDARSNQVDHLGEAWAVKVPPTPVDEGEISGDIDEQSGRFNLNNIAPNGVADTTSIEQFQLLLENVGITSAQAKTLAETLGHWIDNLVEDASAYPPNADGSASAKPPNAALVSVDELASVPGFDAATVERLRPFVAALPSSPARSVINVNTASAEVLSATIPKLTLGTARGIVTARTTAWFKDLADFETRTNFSADPQRFACKSFYFLASGRAHFGSATTRMQVLLSRGVQPSATHPNWPEIIWQKIL